MLGPLQLELQGACFFLILFLISITLEKSP